MYRNSWVSLRSSISIFIFAAVHFITLGAGSIRAVTEVSFLSALHVLR